MSVPHNLPFNLKLSWSLGCVISEQAWGLLASSHAQHMLENNTDLKEKRGRAWGVESNTQQKEGGRFV